MLKIDSELAYILHSYPYRETSLILEVFTQHHGLLSVIAKGAKRPQSRIRSLLQPFTSILLACSGRHELLTLTDANPALIEDPPKYRHDLFGQRVFSAFYINELLIRLLHRRIPEPRLFDLYQKCLNDLENADHTCEETVLRLFEKKLLECLGYALQLTKETQTGASIRIDQWYLFDPEYGPKHVLNATPATTHSKGCIVAGQSLIDLEQEIFQTKQSLKDAKKITRYALSLHLGLKPLATRRLFSAMQAYTLDSA